MQGMDAISKAIKRVGGVSKMAARLGLRQNVVGNWKLRKKVPAQHCAAVSAATEGVVTVHDLRPDVFGPAPKRKRAA